MRCASTLKTPIPTPSSTSRRMRRSGGRGGFIRRTSISCWSCKQPCARPHAIDMTRRSSASCVCAFPVSRCRTRRARQRNPSSSRSSTGVGINREAVPVKTLLMIVLCVPLLWTLANQVRLLVNVEDPAGRDSPADASRDLKGPIGKAHKQADAYARVSKAIVTLSEERIDADNTAPLPDPELAARLNDYAKMLRETRLAMDVLKDRRPRNELPEQWRKWCTAVDRPEKLYSDLRKSIA